MGSNLFLFEDLSFSENETEQWIHWPQFYHLRYEFLSYQYWKKISWLESGEADLVEFVQNWIAPSFIDYEVQFRNIQNLLEAKQIQKAVPVVFEVQQGKKPSRLQLFALIENLLKAPNVIAYGVIRGDEGVIGATPEQLFAIRDHHLSTMAVAGTSWGSQLTELDEDPRLMEEHRWVVEDLSQKLRGRGSIQQGVTQKLNLGSLIHLKTAVTCDLFETPKTQKDFYFLVKALHPTSALGLISQTLSWKEMEHWPGQERPRHRFGAPLTFHCPGEDTVSLVSIRQLAWDQEGSRIGSGGGLVLGCDLEREWLELEKKREYVKKILGLKRREM